MMIGIFHNSCFKRNTIYAGQNTIYVSQNTLPQKLNPECFLHWSVKSTLLVGDLFREFA